MAKQIATARLPVQAVPWALVRWSYRRARASLHRTIDWVAGVRTTPEIEHGPLAELQLRPSNSQTGWLLIWRLLCHEHPTPQDVLLDIGCGSGRALFCAALLPFSRVQGVDLDPGAVERARLNAASFRSRHKTKIEIIAADATTYVIPDDVTVIFFFNSFRNPLFEMLHNNIMGSLGRRPRRMRLIYGNPIEHDWLMGTGEWRLVRKVRGLRPSAEWARSLSAYAYEARPLVPDEARGPSRQHDRVRHGT